MNGLGEFAPVLEEALEVENVDEVGKVVWVGDGAACNWTLADQLCPDAVQVLDWHHAVEHAMDCGKVLLGEESPWLPVWQRRAEALLAGGNPDAVIAEIMDCMPLVPRRRGQHEALEAVENLVRYYRSNANRMKYRLYRGEGLPIGSGAVESAHRHVLQTRMKRAGQRWALPNARRMARLRAAYRTAGARRFYDAIRRAHWDTVTGAPRLRGRPLRPLRDPRHGPVRLKLIVRPRTGGRSVTDGPLACSKGATGILVSGGRVGNHAPELPGCGSLHLPV